MTDTGLGSNSTHCPEIFCDKRKVRLILKVVISWLSSHVLSCLPGVPNRWMENQVASDNLIINQIEAKDIIWYRFGQPIFISCTWTFLRIKIIVIVSNNNVQIYCIRWISIRIMSNCVETYWTFCSVLRLTCAYMVMLKVAVCPQYKCCINTCSVNRYRVFSPVWVY